MTKPFNPGTPKGCERIAYAVGFQENATYSDVYGGGGAVVGLDCHLIRPVDQPSDTLIVFMHPVGGGMYLPMVRELAKKGHHVLWANSRYRGADYALIMEKVACDLGEAICDARDRMGYTNIVLAGWSGGGSLMMWYQALAEAGIEGLTIHGLRRSFSNLTEWVESPVGIVYQIMGHKPSATAEKHYKKRPLDLLRMWHIKIEKWILEQAC